MNNPTTATAVKRKYRGKRLFQQCARKFHNNSISDFFLAFYGSDKQTDRHTNTYFASSHPLPGRSNFQYTQNNRNQYNWNGPSFAGDDPT